MDDLGVPPFQEPPIWRPNHHLSWINSALPLRDPPGRGTRTTASWQLLRLQWRRSNSAFAGCNLRVAHRSAVLWKPMENWNLKWTPNGPNATLILFETNWYWDQMGHKCLHRKCLYKYDLVNLVSTFDCSQFMTFLNPWSGSPRFLNPSQPSLGSGLQTRRRCWPRAPACVPTMLRLLVQPRRHQG